MITLKVTIEARGPAEWAEGSSESIAESIEDMLLDAIGFPEGSEIAVTVHSREETIELASLPKP
jgi:hypothetical protein